MKKILLAIVLISVLAIVGGRWALMAETEPRKLSPTFHPRPASLDQIAANGVVEGARPEVALRPEVAGTIATLQVRENQQVTKGELLLELQNETQRHQVTLAQAELAIAQGQLDRLRNGEQLEKRKAVAAVEEGKKAVARQAKADCERSRKLSQSDSGSREQYDRDHFRQMVAEAELAQAQAERALVEAPARADEMAIAKGRVAAAQARLQLAQAELAKTRLLAPYSGRVLQVYAEPGELAGPASSQPVLLLADLSKRRVRAFIEELDAAQAKVGQTAVITVDALPGKELKGRVALVLPRMGKRAPQTDLPGEYKDLYFREVLIELETAEDLPLNLRVQTRINKDEGPAPKG
jgi:multidrug resistance efflux pump